MVSTREWFGASLRRHCGVGVAAFRAHTTADLLCGFNFHRNRLGALPLCVVRRAYFLPSDLHFTVYNQTGAKRETNRIKITAHTITPSSAARVQLSKPHKIRQSKLCNLVRVHVPYKNRFTRLIVCAIPDQGPILCHAKQRAIPKSSEITHLTAGGPAEWVCAP